MDDFIRSVCVDNVGAPEVSVIGNPNPWVNVGVDIIS